MFDHIAKLLAGIWANIQTHPAIRNIIAWRHQKYLHQQQTYQQLQNQKANECKHSFASAFFIIPLPYPAGLLHKVIYQSFRLLLS